MIADELAYMPTIEQYMALAEALHDEDDMCNASYVIPFSECATRDHDIEQAVRVLGELHKSGWLLTRDPTGTIALGLRYPAMPTTAASGSPSAGGSGPVGIAGSRKRKPGSA